MRTCALILLFIATVPARAATSDSPNLLFGVYPDDRRRDMLALCDIDMWTDDAISDDSCLVLSLDSVPHGPEVDLGIGGKIDRWVSTSADVTPGNGVWVVTYTIVAGNLGPSPSFGILVQDVLPMEMTLGPLPAACQMSPYNVPPPVIVTCSDNHTLNAGEHRTFVISGTVPNLTATLMNRASVSVDEDPRAINNVATTTVDIAPPTTRRRSVGR